MNAFDIGKPKQPMSSRANASNAAVPQLAVDRSAGEELRAMPVSAGTGRADSDSTPPGRPRKSWFRVGGISLLLIGLVAGALLVWHNAGTNQALNATVLDRSALVKTQNVALPGLLRQLSSAIAGQRLNTLTVNGQLDVNGSLVLGAVGRPANPAPGQLYFDRGLNRLEYYDGTGFVSVQGGSNKTVNNTYVTNVTNAAGAGSASSTGVDALTGSGTPDTLALFTKDNQLGDSLLTQNGSTLATTAGTIQGNGSGGLSITTAAASGSSGTISITSGSSSNAGAGDLTIDTGSSTRNGQVVSDKTFEDGLDNIIVWYGDTVAQSNAEAHSGTYSLAVTANGQYWGIEEASAPNPLTPVIAGHHYYFTAWVRAATSPSQISGSICWNFTACGSVPLTTVTDSTAAWTEMTGTAIAPGGATSASWAFTDNASGAGDVTYFDDFAITDLSASSSASHLYLGADNAQIVTLGSMNEIGATTIDGSSGIALNSGAGPINANGGAITLSGTAVSSFTTTSGNLTLGAGGGSSGVIVKSQADSTSAFQIEDSLGNVLLAADTADMQITIGGNLITSGEITLDGHIVTGGNTPGIAADAAAACGGTATATIAGDDTAGTITVTTGTGGSCSAGDIATVTFNNAYGSAPRLVLTPDDPGAQLLGVYNDRGVLSTSSFSLGTANTPAPSTTYSWDYWVTQ